MVAQYAQIPSRPSHLNALSLCDGLGLAASRVVVNRAPHLKRKTKILVVLAENRIVYL